jgi:hypothetical protein
MELATGHDPPGVHIIFPVSKSLFQTAMSTGFQGEPAPDARQDISRVLLNGLSSAPAIPLLTPCKIGIYGISVHQESRRQSIEKGEGTSSMGFACRIKKEHQTSRPNINKA